MYKVVAYAARKITMANYKAGVTLLERTLSYLVSIKKPQSHKNTYTVLRTTRYSHIFMHYILWQMKLCQRCELQLQKKFDCYQGKPLL
jgi:hypothetical protein